MAMDEGRDVNDAARGAQAVASGATASARQQLSTFVADRVREQIVRGGPPTGRFLRVEALTHELGMSTTPVSEGLLLLCSETFVRLIPRRGFVVNGFISSDLRNVYWAQATLAAELAERAARHMSTLDVERLEVVHDRHELAMDQGDRARAAGSGRQFHRLLNRAARAPRLAQLLPAPRWID